MASAEQASRRVSALLAELVADILPPPEDDEPEMIHPMITEWVLVANVTDLASGENGVIVLNEPSMLLSHVLGLLAVGQV